MLKRILILILFASLVIPNICLCVERKFSKLRQDGMVFSIPRIEQLRIPFIHDVCNSAAPPDSTIWFNVDVLDTLSGLPVHSDVTLWYSFDNQTSWDSSSMMPIDTTGFKIRYQTDIVSPGSGTVYYFIGTENDSGYYGTQSPVNDGNIFPPPCNLLVFTCDEVVGDTTNGAAGSWLDLTGCWAGYSEDSLYIKISNNGGGWPWYESYLFGPWYVYCGGVYNPEAPSDSFAYTLARINSPLLTSNLLKINQYTGEYWVIGGIDESSNADSLWIRCSFADIVNDPDFGPWPNSSGLYLSGTTSTLYISGDFELNDFTEPCRLYPETPTFTAGSNTAPVLTNPAVIPDSGTTDTTFFFSVTYSDADNNLPTLKDVVIDEVGYQMNSDDHSYSDGAEFYFSMDSFSIGEHYFYFQFSDGMDTVNTDMDSFIVTPTGIEEKSDMQNLSNTFRIAQNYPNPFMTSTTIHLSGSVHRAECIDLQIFDATGRRVREISLLPFNFSLAVTWDGRDDDGEQVLPGVYFIRLSSGNYSSVKKIILVR